METRANFLLIGLFTLLGVVLVAIFAIWLGRAQFNRKFDVFDIEFIGPTRGLAQGGEVRFNGIKVGEISRIDLDPDNPSRVVARIRVEASTPFRTDSNIKLDTSLITGVSAIQIEGGSKKSSKPKAAKPGGIPLVKGRLSDSFFDDSTLVLGSADDALRRVSALLSPKNVEHVEELLANLASISEDLAKRKSLVDNADRALAGFADTAASLRTASNDLVVIAANLRQKLDVIGTNAEIAAKDLPEITENLRKASIEANEAATRAKNVLALAENQSLPDISRTAQSLDLLATELRGVVEELERNPSAFLAGQTKRQVEYPR